MKKNVRKCQLTVPGRFDSLPQIAEFVGQAAQQAGFDEDTTFHIQMAVDEACSNIVEHAYGQTCSGDIVLTCRIAANRDFIVTLHDTGCRFDPQAVPQPALGANLEDVPEGGLGLYFMRALMDEVRFEFDPGRGNTLTMVKRRRT